jgi:hypothetical protein
VGVLIVAIVGGGERIGRALPASTPLNPPSRGFRLSLFASSCSTTSDKSGRLRRGLEKVLPWFPLSGGETWTDSMGAT